ncbi:RNA methyltransferase [Citricoccus sp.]|uniref:TrmH family RNA methyltransferase n=1 Tax=Citricoccus sp. TaxID=1978372 RepID=UPI0028BF4011|nr:RNA methyltransferase [Citricoccus sp.]
MAESHGPLSSFEAVGAVELTDPADPRAEVFSGLTDAALRRRQDAAHGIYLAESSLVVRRALDAGHRPHAFFLAHRYLDSMADVFAAHPDVPVYTGTDALLASVTGFHLHRGALAAMERPVPRPVDELLTGARRIAVLENVSDHTNVGAILRSAAAIGIDAVLVTPLCADPFYRRSIRVSMGAVFRVPWTRIDDWPVGIEVLKDAGFTVAGMTLGHGAITLDDLVAEEHERLALVFGHEGAGLAAETEQWLDRRVTIPMMNEVDSLNVAAAAAIAFYVTR